MTIFFSLVFFFFFFFSLSYCRRISVNSCRVFPATQRHTNSLAHKWATHTHARAETVTNGMHKKCVREDKLYRVDCICEWERERVCNWLVWIYTHQIYMDGFEHSELKWVAGGGDDDDDGGCGGVRSNFSCKLIELYGNDMTIIICHLNVT